MRNQAHLFGERELRQLGRAVRDAREKAGLNQSQLAAQSGLSARALRELEAGRSSPSLATILAIVDTLSMTLDELIAAARAKRTTFGLLRARDADQGDAEVPAGIDQPRLKVRVVHVDASDHVNLPGGATFAHVLGGAITATLDGEQVKLRHGDSLHSRPGVLTDLAAADRHAKVLLVEALGSQ